MKNRLLSSAAALVIALAALTVTATLACTASPPSPTPVQPEVVEPTPADTYEALMKRARELRTSGRPLEAEKIYDGILAKNANDSDALTGRGFCRLTDRARGSQALADFEKVISLAPDYVDAYVGKAIVHRRRTDRAAARETLEACRAALGDDEEKQRYLAESCWREGHFVLARTLDRNYPPRPERKLIDLPNEIYVTVTQDWVRHRSGWQSQGVTYVRRFRPDLTWWISETRYRRNRDDDLETGTGVSYRPTYALTLSYELYLANRADFLSDQKHRLKADILVLPNTVLGAGADLNGYGSDWATTGRLELTRYFRSCYGKYTLLTGKDANDENVSTSILEFGCDKELNYGFRVGYATGNESVETGSANVFSEDRIDTAFASLRYCVDPTWGFILGASYEWRDHDPYRTGASLTLFKRF